MRIQLRAPSPGISGSDRPTWDGRLPDCRDVASNVSEFRSARFSALVHNLDHISTACAQLGELSLLHELELSGTLRNAPLK
jgi:hypothetical protein